MSSPLDNQAPKSAPIEDNKQGVIKRTNIRIVDGFSLASLGVVAVAFLWLVSINQSMLFNLIERSDSSTVSLAFLTALEEKSDDEQKISVELLQLEHYLRLGRLEDATTLLLKLADIAESQNNSTLKTSLLDYEIRLILQQYQQANQEQRPALITRYLALAPMLQNSHFSVIRQYADGALSLGLAAVAYDMLAPHAQDQAELLSLALQHENYTAALMHQVNITETKPIAANFNQLAHILKALSSENLAAFFNTYDGTLLDQARFLLLGLELSFSAQNADYRNAYYQALQSKALSESQRYRLAKQALASGDQKLALRYFKDLVKHHPKDIYLAQLHDIHLWQQQIRQALTVTKQRVRLDESPDEALLRTGLNEAIALGDYGNTYYFYRLLDQADYLNSDEKVAYVDLSAKVKGSPAALRLVSRLVKRESNNVELFDQQARLAMGLGQYALLPDIWQAHIANNAVDQRRAMDFSEAYVQQASPSAALAVLIMPSQWQTFDNNYLERVFNLAWQESEVEIARQAQQAQMQKPEYSLHDKQTLYRFSQLYRPLSSLGLDKLFELYQRWPEPGLLYAALDFAIKQQDQAGIKKAISLANRNPALEQKNEFVYLRVLLAMQDGDQALSNRLFKTLLRNSTQQADINTYFWWLIDSEQWGLLAQAYQQYSLPSVRSLDLNSTNYLSPIELQTLMVLAAAATHLDYPHHVERYLATALANIDPRQSLSDTTEVAVAYANQLDLNAMAQSALLLRNLVFQSQKNQLKPELVAPLKSRYASGSDYFNHLKNQALKTPSQASYLALIDYYLARGDIHSVEFWLEKTGIQLDQLSHSQQLVLALRKHDKLALERLVDGAHRLPVADEAAALQNLARFEDAWQLAQQQLGTLTFANDERQLLQQVQNLRSWKANSVGMQFKALAHWDIQTFSSFSYIPTAKGQWRIQLDQQQAQDIAPLSNNDSDENRLRIAYQWQTRYGEKSRSLEARVELDIGDGLGEQRLGLDAEVDVQLDDYWRLGASLEYQAHTELSRLAYLAAQDNRVQIRASYQPTRRQQISMALTAHDIETRFGDPVASGFDVLLRLSERLYFADPAIEVYGSLSSTQLDYSSQSLPGISQAFALANPLLGANIVEDNFSQVRIGQRLSSGQFMTAGIPSPIDRYWLDTSVGFNSNSQFNAAVSAGMGWRIFNHDELSLSLDWQSRDTNGDASTVLSLGYYHNY